MGPGGIATIIAASSLAVIALAVAYVVVRVGRLVDQAKASLDTFTKETTPLIEEATHTVQLVNGPLESINKLTTTAEKFATGLKDSNSTLGPIMKIISFVAANKKKKNNAAEEVDEEFGL